MDRDEPRLDGAYFAAWYGRGEVAVQPGLGLDLLVQQGLGDALGDDRLERVDLNPDASSTYSAPSSSRSTRRVPGRDYE